MHLYYLRYINILYEFIRMPEGQNAAVASFGILIGIFYT